MPVHQNIKTDKLEICIWKITESFEELRPLLAHGATQETYTNAPRNIQWLAARLALNTLSEEALTQLYKDEFGKPQIDDRHISLSHTEQYASAMISDTPVGIDVEEITPRILRIANRFLHVHEHALIDANNPLPMLYLIWCAKEALFKLYGKKSVDFAKHICVHPFKISERGFFKVDFLKYDKSTYQAHYQFFDNHCMVWIY